MNLKANLPGGLKWIFVILIKATYPTLPHFADSFIFISSSFFFFFWFSKSSFLDFFFIWRPILNPFDLMVHPQCRLRGSTSSQSDPSIVPPHFSQNQLGLSERESILPLTCLHLYRSSQAGNEVGFLILLLLFWKFLAFT